VEIDDALVERLAQLIHAQYLGRQAAAVRPGKPARSRKSAVTAAPHTSSTTAQATTARPAKATKATKPTKAKPTKASSAGQTAGPTTPAGLPSWSELDDGMRNASRDQARDIAAKLRRIGCSVEPGTPTTPFTFGPDELDLLAKEEHLRWVRERTAAGWVPGPVRDNARKVHPCLVGWDALDETERDKDRDAVLDIPIVLAAAGLRIVRTPVS
jgi:hypothetical protein